MWVGMMSMNRIEIVYQGGESRNTPGKVINYLQAHIEGLELYAEADPFELDETTIYRTLMAEILRQADMHGILSRGSAFCD